MAAVNTPYGQGWAKEPFLWRGEAFRQSRVSGP